VKQEPYDGRRFGHARWENGAFGRHRHAFGYVCVVLGGRFTEAGDVGRFRAEPGDVLIHRPHEAHLDLLSSPAADLLNLPLTDGFPSAGRVRIADPDRIARLAERDPFAAAQAVAAACQVAAGEADWPDLLAATLRSRPRFAIGDWARRHGLTPEAVSRGFRRAYGTTPVRYRAEARARRAWHAVATTDRPLVELAFDLGFADQAHMTRAFKHITGLPPSRWRSPGQIASRPAEDAHLG
jgi:AraC-like DNA-binding protein